MNLNKALNEYNSIIDTYHGLQWHDGSEISQLLKDLSVIMSYLEKHRTDYHKKWREVSFKENSVAAGERMADKDVPELYMLRRIMTAGYRVMDAMRSNISYIKKEK